MQVKIIPSKSYAGVIDAPVSKSVAHRLLIAAALSNKDITIKGKLAGDDIVATAQCLKAMGYLVEFSEQSIRISHSSVNKKVILDVNESGSTLRFLLPVVAALGIESEFVTRGRLAERPLSPLISVMEYKGAVVQSSPLKVCGKLTAGIYDIEGGVSSQFISGLLFALPLLSGDSFINIIGKTVSQSYIDITLSVLKISGIEIIKKDNGYFVRGGQKYNLPDGIVAEGDWSSAAFFAVLGSLKGNISIRKLNVSSRQGDRAVVELLRRAGAKISYTEQGFVCKKSKLKAIEFSAEDIPDLIPILSIALSCAKGISKITDVDRLKDKECDRLAAVMEMLSNFGISCHYENNALYIVGGTLKGGNIKGYSDHRIVMSAAVGGCVAKGVTVVSDKQSINKSYPSFFEELQSIGGTYEDLQEEGGINED